jgi:hypothetical protein
MGLKDLFFKTDEFEEIQQSAKAQKPTKPAVAPTQATSLTATPSQFTAPTISPEEKNEFVEFLNEVYKKGNFPGPDFQEFTDALKAMDSMPMDEKTKFNAVFAGFKVQGVSKAKLLETAGKYISMIQAQTSAFSKEIDNMLNTEVIEKQRKAEALAKENAEIEKQMIALTEKKNKNNEQAAAINGEITAQVSSLNVKKTSFEAAAADFTNRVQQTAQKIEQYLPA